MPSTIVDIALGWLRDLIADPNQMLIWAALTVGFLFGESFSKFDWVVQHTDWFSTLGQISWFLTKGILDLTHHFQYGLVLMWYAYQLVDPYSTVLFNFGFGLFMSDVRDFQNLRLRFTKLVMTQK